MIAPGPRRRSSAREVDWFALSPLLVLLGGAMLLLVAGALTPAWPRGLLRRSSPPPTAGRPLRAGVVLVGRHHRRRCRRTLVGGALAFDTFAMFVTITICVAVLLVALDHRRLPAPRGRSTGPRSTPCTCSPPSAAS